MSLEDTVKELIVGIKGMSIKEKDYRILFNAIEGT